MKLAIINAKGGTAKTTTTINLAHALVVKKLKVLICDLDPQASASLSLGFKRENLHPSMADVLLEEYPVMEAIRQTSIEGLDCLTSSMALSGFDVNFASKKGRENQLKNVLDQVKGYDIIMIDCPPTLGFLSVNALVAADHFIVPVVPQYLALEGLATLTEAFTKIKAGVGIRCTASLMWIIFTQVDRRGKATGEIINLIRKQYGEAVFKTEIGVNTRVAEAPSFGKTVLQHNGLASGSKAYQKLAEEVFIKFIKLIKLKRIKQEEAKDGKKN
jgi:chromosome partitioning protein